MYCKDIVLSHRKIYLVSAFSQKMVDKKNIFVQAVFSTASAEI